MAQIHDLPIELICAIFDFLRPRSLKSGTLVCRSWNEIIRPQLFRKVVVDPSTINDPLDSCKDLNPLFNVRHLIRHMVFVSTLSECITPIAVDEILGKDPLGIQTLTLEELDPEDDFLMPTPSLSTVTTLHVSDCNFSTRLLLDFVSSLPILHCLDIEDFWPAEHSLSKGCLPLPPPCLTVLRLLDTSDLHGFASWISNPLSVATIRTLVIHVETKSLGGFTSLYQNLAHTIEEFEFKIIRPRSQKLSCESHSR